MSAFPFPPVWLLRRRSKKKKTEVFGVMIVSIVLSIFFLRNFVSNPVVLDGGSITRFVVPFSPRLNGNIEIS